MAEIKLSVLAKNAALNAIGALVNAGKLRIYSGDVPATCDTALVVAQVLLAELTFGATAFAAAADASMAVNAITQDTSADHSGEAAFYRAFATNGTTAHLQGTVGATGSGAALELNATAISAGGIVQVTALTHTM